MKNHTQLRALGRSKDLFPNPNSPAYAIIVMSRHVKGKMPEGDIYDVFVEFYQLGVDMKKSSTEYQNEYIVVRLVTILEQFFRCVIELELKRHPENIPRKITLDTQSMNDIICTVSKGSRRITLELIASYSYSFQNTKSIENMQQYSKTPIFEDESRLPKHGCQNSPTKQDYDELFETRHQIVHSVDRIPYLDVEKYYSMTEDLLEHVLKQVRSWIFFVNQGEALEKFKNSDKATKCFDAAEDCVCDLVTSRDRAFEHQKNQEYDSAIKCFNTTLCIDPDDYSSYFGKAFCLLRLGKYRQAAKSFEQELSMVKDPGGYFCMGLILQKLDRHIHAIGYFEKALKDESIKGLACLCLAVSYGILGRFDNALNFTNKALTIEPENRIYLKIKTMYEQNIQGRDEQMSRSKSSTTVEVLDRAKEYLNPTDYTKQREMACKINANLLEILRGYQENNIAAAESEVDRKKVTSILQARKI